MLLQDACVILDPNKSDLVCIIILYTMDVTLVLFDMYQYYLL